VSNAFSQALSPVYSKYGLGLLEWRVIATLGSFGELNGKQVGAHTGMHKTNVSRIVHGLIARNLIESNYRPRDQRAMYLRLTVEGQQRYRECSPLVMELARHLEDAIELEDREAFTRVLLKLTERAKYLASNFR